MDGIGDAILMPNAEERAYFEGLDIIEEYLSNEQFWIDKLKIFLPRSPRDEAFRHFVQTAYVPVWPEKRAALLAAYFTYRNRLHGASDDQLIPPGLDEF